MKREEEKEQSERELEKRMFETDVVVTMERAPMRLLPRNTNQSTRVTRLRVSAHACMRAQDRWAKDLDFRP